jgi:hypothetical protein
MVVAMRARCGPLALPRHPRFALGLSAIRREAFFVAMNHALDTRILPADLVTPVGAYLRLRAALGAPAFLLESVERGEQVGRYSFLGCGLRSADSLAEAVAFSRSQPPPEPGQPPFVGGAVGYVS